MGKRRIFCDLDMTLCNTIHPVIDMVKRDFGVDFQIHDFNSYGFLEEQLGPTVRKYWSEPDLYTKVPLYAEAQWFIECLAKIGEVHIITYSSDYSIRKYKDEFVDKYFKVEDIHHSREKHEILTSDDILIDDYLVNIQGHIHHNKGYGILFNFLQSNPWAEYHLKSPLTKNHLHACTYKKVIQQVRNIFNETGV